MDTCKWTVVVCPLSSQRSIMRGLRVCSALAFSCRAGLSIVHYLAPELATTLYSARRLRSQRARAYLHPRYCPAAGHACLRARCSPVTTCSQSAVAIGHGQILLFGGTAFPFGEINSNELFLFSTHDNTWRRVSSLRRCTACAAQVNLACTHVHSGLVALLADCTLCCRRTHIIGSNAIALNQQKLS